jgi:superfamily II DNA helicase RecQ
MTPATTRRVDWQSLYAKAQSVFGITAFRPGQRELIAAVLTGRDAFGILPTGGGKSLVFQSRAHRLRSFGTRRIVGRALGNESARGR